MNLWQAAGFIKGVRVPDGAVQREEAMKALVAEAEVFLIGGGMLTLGDWRDLDDAEKEAFQRAGLRLRASLAAQAGLASQGRREAAEVARTADDGAAAASGLAQEAAEQAALRLGAGALAQEAVG